MVDTSVLISLLQPSHQVHVTALDALAILEAQGEPVYIVPQNLYELWVVTTRPIAQNGFGLLPAQAEQELIHVKSIFSLLDDTPALLSEWQHLVVAHQVVGKPAHDTRLVAAMNIHHLANLLTNNTSDFRRYTGINVMSPMEVIARSATNP